MDNVYTIVGIDPGNNLGVGILYVDIDTNKITKVESRTFVLDRYINRDLVPNVMLARCQYLQNIVSSMVFRYQPVIVGLEAAFMNVRFATSVIQLSQYVMSICLAVSNTRPFTKIIKYPPKYIKASVGAGGNADKDDMKSNLLKIKEISSYIDIDYLTEHEIDALSIAYLTYKEVLLNPYLLITLPNHI